MAPSIAGGKFLAGLISGGETVAVPLHEGLDTWREVTGTLCATKAGNWGLGIYVQTADNRQALAHFGSVDKPSVHVPT